MNLLLAKLTSKYQATVPKPVREALHLEAHDQIAYEILEDNTVILRRVTPFDIEYLAALSTTLSEWESENDERAYGHL